MTSNNEKIANYLDTLFRLTPDFKDTFEKRYKILKMIDMIGPVGRRTLSTKIDISERIIRKETDVLKENKLLESSNYYLIEGNNWHDNYWGKCYCAKCTKIDGQNKLGAILMKLRDMF